MKIERGKGEKEVEDEAGFPSSLFFAALLKPWWLGSDDFDDTSFASSIVWAYYSSHRRLEDQRMAVEHWMTLLLIRKEVGEKLVNWSGRKVRQGERGRGATVKERE